MSKSEKALVRLAAIFLEIAIGQWLWNTLAVPLFNAPHVTYWQFFGLVFLVSVILTTFVFKEG